MQNVKEGIGSTPNGLMHESTSKLTSNSNRTSIASPSSLSGDDSSETSHAIPSALIKEEWQLVLDQDASMPDLIYAIDRCKELALSCADISEEKKWIVRHLVELRYRLSELQDVADDPDANKPETKVILGHHFTSRQLGHLPKHKIFCDHCTGVIWSVVQASYICQDCGFCVHHKCLRRVLRVCAHVIASEKDVPIEAICPEVGIASQKYKCGECPTQFEFGFSTSVNCFGREYRTASALGIEPRLCDYSGLHYCPTCHWNDTSVIPARILHNWDFVPRKVGRASLQEIQLMYDSPVINLEEKNPKLFIYVHGLSLAKKLREDLYYMKQYLTACRFATEEKLIEINTGARRHLIQTKDIYSIADLVAVDNGTLAECLHKMHDIFERHIRNCEICKGKAYICEVCGNNEAIFPFDDCSVPCWKCNSVYHRACWWRKNSICVKCVRLEKRKQKQENEILDLENGN